MVPMASSMKAPTPSAQRDHVALLQPRRQAAGQGGRRGLIRQLDSNSGLAQLLTFFQANFGDWRKLFTSLDDIDKVTADDVQRVARQYLTPDNRTIAFTNPPPEVADPS